MGSSSKDYKSSSHKRRRDSVEEYDKSSKSAKHSKTSSSLNSTIKPIDEEDYFEKATEFRLWLKEYKHKYFDELSSKDARRYFRKFVKKWNDYELNEKFYKGISSTQLDSSDATRYKWSFAKKLDNQWELDTVRDSVDSMTSGNNNNNKEKQMSNKRRTQPVGPTMPDSNTLTLEREERYEREKMNRKYEARKRAERREDILDEVAPKEIGREAALAKKRALNAYHKRERSPDIELSEADLMGSDDFQAR
ncbi:uncharacterized protein BX663DRAFT_503856 [Cokeromyces recurvatus]|uniref:uncharacterized protein n=1 Tax=Cokeromyces recurvatus TaxID=90255 RepID=UPI002220598E|nr:uncharacterized protein BX663DRAFT_503856 [Cokeromyces recurvatus]KAI7904868.1 hypothetical protein BX663DRAFT_503856 [Cokeromyces recurvatus]